jgi:hypothetical protein
MHLGRESQPQFDGLYENDASYEYGSFYEDMHSLHQDQGDAFHVR